MSTEVATGARARPADERWRPIDHLRAVRWNEHRDAGLNSIQAWAEVMMDPGIGFADWRGKKAIPPFEVASRFALFKQRCSHEALGAARGQAELRLALVSEEAIQTVLETMRGEHDTERPLKAAQTILRCTGILPTGSRVTQAVQVNVSHDAACLEVIREAEEWTPPGEGGNGSK